MINQPAIAAAGTLTLATGVLFGETWASAHPGLFSLQAAGAAGGAMLAMAATNTEHAPAAGTALAIAGNGFDWQLIFFVATSVLILSAVHRLIRHRLIDLY